MFAEERQKEIAEAVQKDGRVETDALAEKYQVTKDLIRKDLNALEKNGLLKKVYGGAVAVRSNPHQYESSLRKNTNPQGRKQIAEKAVSLIQEGDRIYLDVSVTSIRIAELLVKNGIQCHVVTNMLEVLNVLAPDKNIDVFFLGGTLNQERDGFWSAASLSVLSKCHIDKAFIGTVGIDIEKGIISTYQEADGELKKKAMEGSEECYALADTYKFHEDGDYTYAKISDFTALITDEKLGKEDKKLLKQGKVKVL